MSIARILYLHGLLSSPTSRKARLFKERLEARGEPVVVPDLSQGDFRALTTSRAATLAAALGHEMAPPVVLMGSSFGGRVALHAAAALSGRVAGLVLMAPALRFDAVWPSLAPAETLARWSERGALEVDHPVLGDRTPLGYSFCEDAATTDELPDLRPNLPVLILHGTRDDVVPIALSESLARRHPAARLVPLDAAHKLSGQDDRLWAEVEPFLEQVLRH